MEQENMPNSAKKAGKLVLIIGPSGVGKSVILKRLRATHPEFHFPRSATTRMRRAGEGDELYHFVSEEDFNKMHAEEKFLEWAKVHGVGRYATMVDEIVPFIKQGKTVVREVDVQGFDSINKNPLFAGTSAPYPLQTIFIMPDSTENLVNRIRNRAPISEEELAKRIASMEKELVYAEQCQHIVKNMDGSLEETIGKVEKLIMA